MMGSSGARPLVERTIEMAESKPASEATGTCPMCSRPTQRDYRPFCSRRCADIDLSRWLRGAYAIPDKEDDEQRKNAAKLPQDGIEDDSDKS